MRYRLKREEDEEGNKLDCKSKKCEDTKCGP